MGRRGGGVGGGGGGGLALEGHEASVDARDVGVNLAPGNGYLTLASFPAVSPPGRHRLVFLPSLPPPLLLLLLLEKGSLPSGREGFSETSVVGEPGLRNVVPAGEGLGEGEEAVHVLDLLEPQSF